RHTRFDCDWSSDVCSSDLIIVHDPRKITKFVATGANTIVAGRASNGSRVRAVFTRIGGEIGRAAIEHFAERIAELETITCKDRRSEERRVGKECRCRSRVY